MRVAVGSGNPVKRRTVERVLAGEVEAVIVDSGVSDQPRGRAETVTGARNRARAAYDAGEFDLGVGLEGGVAEFDGETFLVMWAAVTDGTDVEVGAGPAIRLPDPIAARVEAGEELGPVLDDLLDAEGVARRRGAIGVLTDGRIDRERALADAVACALGPFVTDRY